MGMLNYANALIERYFRGAIGLMGRRNLHGDRFILQRINRETLERGDRVDGGGAALHGDR